MIRMFQFSVTVPPSQGQPDVNIPLNTSIQSDESALVLLVQYVNEYLWYMVAFLALAMVIYAGFKLMTANGEDKRSEVGNIFLNLVVGVLIIIFSAVLVSLLVNLF